MYITLSFGGTAGVLLTRRRMAINHGNWLMNDDEEEEVGFT